MIVSQYSLTHTHTAHTVRIKTFRVVRTGTRQVTHFVTDEALGVGILPLRNIGLAPFRRVSGCSTLETDSRS